VRELLKGIQKGNIQMNFCNKYRREELYIKYQFVLGIYRQTHKLHICWRTYLWWN